MSERAADRLRDDFSRLPFRLYTDNYSKARIDMSERDPTYKERLRDDFARIAFKRAVELNIAPERVDAVVKIVWALADKLMAARNPPPAEEEKKDK